MQNKKNEDTMLFPIVRGLAILLWLVIVANLFIVFPDPVSTALNITAIVLLAAHLAEFIFLNKVISRLPDTTAVAFIKTMLFGLFYWKDPAARNS